MKELSSQELRIGNYVEYGGVLNKVYLLSHNYFQVESTDIPIFKASKNRAARPIPLTEELLLKFGFKEERILYFVYNGFEVGTEGGDFVHGFWTVRIFKAMCVKVQYIHQLQNLYFALTGEELTLEP